MCSDCVDYGKNCPRNRCSSLVISIATGGRIVLFWNAMFVERVVVGVVSFDRIHRVYRDPVSTVNVRLANLAIVLRI